VLCGLLRTLVQKISYYFRKPSGFGGVATILVTSFFVFYGLALSLWRKSVVETTGRVTTFSVIGCVVFFTVCHTGSGLKAKKKDKGVKTK
jgi:hypothetical protein